MQVMRSGMKRHWRMHHLEAESVSQKVRRRHLPQHGSRELDKYETSESGRHVGHPRLRTLPLVIVGSLLLVAALRRRRCTNSQLWSGNESTNN